MNFSSGLPETACGLGSTLRMTDAIRRAIPAMLSDFGVTSLLDAPCGDFNWMAETDISGIDYIGADYSADRIKSAQAKTSLAGCAPRSRTFIECDLISGPLPTADAMLCRDFLQHLPNADVLRVLGNIRHSTTEWLLVTTFSNETNQDIVRRGGFRPLNLERQPFSLPPPRQAVPDPPDSGRFLAVWNRSDLL